jgi:hypothetical protein
MTNEQLIEIVEKFDKWLDDTATEYNILKMDLQELIKRLLIG